MDPLVLVLVLSAAVCHASWNALLKSGPSPWVRMGITIGISGVCGLAMIPFFPVPEARAWPYLLGSSAAHQIYFVTVCLGYRYGDLSQVYPIQRGIAPFLVAVGAYLFAGETLTPYGVAAVTIICLAILSLAFGERRHGTNVRAVAIAFVTGSIIATYTLFDGLGGRSSGDVWGYIAWLNFIDAIPFCLVVAYLARHQPVGRLKTDFRAGTVGGVLAFIAYAMVIWALSITPMTYVSALRETSVVIAAFIGSRILNEPFGGRRIAASALVAAGVILLQASKAL